MNKQPWHKYGQKKEDYSTEHSGFGNLFSAFTTKIRAVHKN